MMQEINNIQERYARRQTRDRRWDDPLAAPGHMIRQEKQRALLRWIHDCRLAPLASKRLLEVGCGTGSNLLEFLQLGFDPARLVGNELLPERARAARHRLPGTLRLLEGDALTLRLPPESFDIVFQSTVFTSILDTAFQRSLAGCMWNWVAPGGGVLWYDFVYDNPQNPDVRGVPLSRIRQLFPHGRMRHWRLTLAPPLNRLLTRIHPFLYTLCNTVPALRTHVLCWIEKDSNEQSRF
jgi:SAM-dependent methyltransferase